MKKHLELNLQKLCHKRKDDERSTSVSREEEGWLLPVPLRPKPEATPASSCLNSKKNSLSGMPDTSTAHLRKETFKKSNALLSI
jgi:hypothetical protein